MPTADIEAALAAFRFGPEGTGTDGFERDDFARQLARRRIAVKPALLDQRIVAGIGNIYVDEALHRARIHPSTPANSLDRRAVGRLSDAIVWAPGRGIEQGGAKSAHGKAYPVDGFPAVHARKDEPCPDCGATVEKIRVGGRG